MADEKDPRPGPEQPHDIKPVSILDEMKRSYLDYAMSVIVSRALPDVRDGLKPVHRRILYSMHENNFTPDRPYNKSSRTVGDTMGKFHPHGDLAIYDALVRMAQDFSMRAPLIDGQGNFGSVDGDPPAASRYTEARLEKIAMSMLEDLDKDTVDFRPNYDEKEFEPAVLPARFPNLLVNGAGGIAVGMATNIPPHNLAETIDGALALMDKPDMSVEELMEYIPGPDFPTGGAILGRAGIRAAYATGRGSIIMRSKTAIETLRKDREAIIVTEIPYQVNKATLIEKIAELVREKKIEGISDLRDESDRDGMRIVIELKRDAVADVVLNQLWRFTQMQSSFGANMIALNGGKPEMLTLHDMLTAFLDFREEVVTRRTKHLVDQGARRRAHPGRPGDRGRQHRRSDPPHPHFARPGGGARSADGAGLAGARHGAADPPHRRSAPHHRRGRHDKAFRSAGARHSRVAPGAPDRVGSRRDRRSAAQTRRRDRRLSGYFGFSRPPDGHHSRRAQ